jgi:hypothetical protein
MAIDESRLGKRFNVPESGAHQILARMLTYGLIVLALSTAEVFACADGQVKTCRRADGSAGTQACVDGKWRSCDVAPLPRSVVIGDRNDSATVLADADTFSRTWFSISDDQEAAQTDADFPMSLNQPPLWAYGARIEALVRIYDLVAPLDSVRGDRYLERLRRILSEVLARRDDKRRLTNGQVPMDAFRHRIMAGWGGITHDRDDLFNTDAVTSALMTYGMAAFARRVADDPALQARHPSYRQNAVDFTNASLETFSAFLPEMHLSDNDPVAYLDQPLGYAQLKCVNGATYCNAYRETAGKPLAYNENLSMMKALADTALAANSALYRGSASATLPFLALATKTAPLLIAKDVEYFSRHLDRNTHTFPGVTLIDWYTQEPDPPKHTREDTGHSGFVLSSLAVIYEDKDRLDSLLEAQRRPKRVNLNNQFLDPFVKTFLRSVWVYDFQNANGTRNILKGYMDPENADSSKNYNGACAGWVTFARFDPWVWVRCRDVVFHPPWSLHPANHAALLRYRPPVASGPQAAGPIIRDHR